MSGTSRWERLEALFDKALEQPAAERVGWVRLQAWNDPALGDEVLAMLAAHRTGEWESLAKLWRARGRNA
jgi:hypothetical protein